MGMQSQIVIRLLSAFHMKINTVYILKGTSRNSRFFFWSEANFNYPHVFFIYEFSPDIWQPGIERNNVIYKSSGDRLQ